MIEELITMGETLPITIGTEIPIVKYMELGEPEYSELRINVLTLIRNIVSQITIKGMSGITIEDVLSVCDRDINAILGLIPSAVFYGTDIINLATPKLIPHLKEPKTVKQKWQSGMMTNGTRLMCKRYDLPFYPGIITGQYKSIYLSHLVMDILTTPKAVILESHTGAIVTRKDFHKKFTRAKNVDSSTMPMTLNTLLFIGTGDLFRSPWEKEQVSQLYLISVERGWTYMTSDEIIKLHLATDNPILYNRFNQQPTLNIKQ
jgi:hypothetical protein